MNLRVRNMGFKRAVAGGFWGMTILAACSAPYTFSNTNFVAINDSANSLTPAMPYPSTNIVSGLTGQITTKVTVTLQGLSHTFPSDVSVLLVGPQGQSAI